MESLKFLMGVNTVSVYVVNWNLNKEKGSSGYTDARDALLKRIKTFDWIRDPNLNTTIFIDAGNLSAQEVSKYLLEVMDSNDRILVSIVQNLTVDCDGWLHGDIWEWVSART